VAHITWRSYCQVIIILISGSTSPVAIAQQAVLYEVGLDDSGRAVSSRGVGNADVKFNRHKQLRWEQEL